MGEKHYRQNRRHHHPRRMGQSQPATKSTKEELLRPHDRRVQNTLQPATKTKTHRQSPENADWLAMDLSNMRSLLQDRKSTRLNSSHVAISYAVLCLKKTSNPI